jgi:nitrogen fixation/metabolism regulation signal transduction histidine kinase
VSEPVQADAHPDEPNGSAHAPVVATAQVARRRGQRFGYEARIALMTALLVVPLLTGSILLIADLPWLNAYRALSIGTLVGLSVYLWRRLLRVIVRPLLTLVNLLDSLRAGDYSLRALDARRGDALGEVLWELNALSSTLREQRLKVEETGALLSKVLANVDIAIFALDHERRLILINAAGERLLSRRASAALGHTAHELGLDACCECETPATLKTAFPGGAGSFDLRRATFRQGGRPHELIAVTDLSRALREEERQAWQRLIRVLGHELNNSLAPIRSMAATISSMIARQPPPEDWREDVLGGLSVIGDRAESLTRFMSAYTRLARLPAPNKRTLALAPLVRRAARLEQRRPVDIGELANVELHADPDQLEQALINLIKNATEASLETGGRHVEVRLRCTAEEAIIEIEDDGPGLAKTENLFVPFFTTKPGGSGVGLVLARQIVENHGGRLGLGDRPDARGCLVKLVLPLTE